jgi:HK97 family phage portal protein
MWPFKTEKRTLAEKASSGGKLTADEWRTLTYIEGYWPDAGASSSTGGTVSTARALALVPVFGSVRILADSIASLPLVLYTKDARGITRRQPTPSLFAQPSVHGTTYDWIFRAVTSLALQGDAIGLKTATDYYGYPTMIEWLNPEQVATQDGKMSGPGSYVNPLWWWWGRPLDPKQFIHIPWFAMPWRVRGLSPIGAYQLAVNTGIGAEEYQANWFGQGGVPPGTLKNAERTIDPKEADTLTSRLVSRLQARKPLVYGRDWDYTPIAIKPHEAQFIETMQLTATQVATIYGLPPEMVGGTTGTSLTYSTVEMNTLKFLTFSLRPWLVRLEYVLTNCFPRGYFVKFDTSELTRVDAKTRAEIDSLSLGYQNMGWKDDNEVRATYDLPPRAPRPIVVPAAASQQEPSNGQEPTKPSATNGDGDHAKISNTNAGLSGSTPRSGRQALLETMRVRWETPT